MAVAYVQQCKGTFNSGVISFGVTWAAPTTAGNLLIAIFSSRTPGAGPVASAVVPPAGKGWVQACTVSVNYGNGGGRALLEIWYSPNAASQSGSQTWSCTGGNYMGPSSNAVCAMFEYSGIDASSPLDVVATSASPNDAGAFAYSTDTSCDTGTPSTTSQATTMAFAAFQNLTALGDPSNSFTERLDGGTISGGHYVGAAEKILVATDTPNSSETYSPAATSLGAIATFKYTAAGGATAVPHILTLGVG